MTKKPTVLVWLDLETTGLNPKWGTGRILEYFVSCTDISLNPICNTGGIIKQNIDNAIQCMDNNEVVEMHTKNGLIEEIRLACGKNSFYEDSIVEEEKRIIAMLDAYCNNSNLVLAGFSVHFDRAWIKEFMPSLEKKFSHRHMDVSLFKVAFPELVPQVDAAHRAEKDVIASQELHKKFRSIVLGKTK